MDHVAQWSFDKRLGDTLRRTLPKLGPEARAQLEGIINPTSIAIMAGVLIAWIASHAFGLGEVIDIILVDQAADNLGSLGFRPCSLSSSGGAKAPRSGTGGRINVGVGPTSGGLRYKPTIRQTPTMPAGHGITSLWGDIEVSTWGSVTQQAVTLLHERVHQFLAPKLYLLRGYRASSRWASYVRSSLWRYIEEALAETIGQVGVNGFAQFFQGVKFPVQNGYMYLRRSGGFDPRFTGHGLIPEASALLYSGIVAGLSFELRFQPGSPPQVGAP
jgi:hypothetical protein